MFRLIACLFAVILFVVPLQVRAAAPVSGRDYTEIKAPAPDAAATKILVVEFFSFYCWECSQRAAAMRQWRDSLSSDVATYRVVVPIVDSRGKEPANHAFLALQGLAQGAALEDAIYRVIHEGKRGFADVNAFREWLLGQKISPEEFDSAYNSFGTNARQQQAMRWTHALASTREGNVRIPSLLIDGRYIVEFGLTDFEEKLAVANALIERARAARTAPRQ